ncbi:MAG: hypothetical protein KJO07_07840 [Deltaproteobacteria bacterium]|nr:hypothetical protein [Deltaproteobacteria bacterium]
MRTLLTIVLGLVFVAGFTAYFVGASVVKHLGNADDVVEAARQGQAHELVVDVLEASLKQELEASDATFKLSVEGALRPLIESVVSADWFYETLAIGYGGFAEVVSERNGDRKVDLSPRKQELRDKLYELGERALARCRSLSPDGSCAREGQTLVRDYRAGVDNVLKAMPGETSLSEIIDELGHRFLPPQLARSRAIKDSARTLRIFRWACLAALAVLGVVIFGINLGPLARALVALGLVLMVSAALNLALLSVVGGQLGDEIHAEFDKVLAAEADPVVRVAVSDGERVVRAQLDYALGDASPYLAGWLIAGAVSLAAGIALSKRRRT